MNDNTAVVQNHPAGASAALGMQRSDTGLFQTNFNLIMNRQQLAVAITAADNKVIGETANITGIKQNDIVSLLIAGSFYSKTCYFNRFQNQYPRCYYTSWQYRAKVLQIELVF